MRRVVTVAELRDCVAAWRRDGLRVGFVPTMGALHRGHLSLVEEARTHADRVVVSIFVNPTQFGEGEDLDAYPRDVDADEAALADLGDLAPDLVFAPTVAEVYATDAVTTVRVAALTDVLCGASRPGHFDGVATVVTKLFNMVQPDLAVFGRKDFQQLAIIRRMVRDLNVPVEVVAGPTVREADGVAMSSRNRYLTGQDRVAARALSRALRAAVEQARAARTAERPIDPGSIIDAATGTLAEASGVRIDYVEALDAETLGPPDTRGQGPTGGDVESPQKRLLLVAVAAHVGTARLIDNVVIGDLADEERLLEATSSV
jgi:pantoate--beta-alanine ligase